jgi:hypothetical protein
MVKLTDKEIEKKIKELQERRSVVALVGYEPLALQSLLELQACDERIEELRGDNNILVEANLNLIKQRDRTLPKIAVLSEELTAAEDEVKRLREVWESKEPIKVELVEGVSGHCLCIEDYRVAGPKFLGGGRIERTFQVQPRLLKQALTEALASSSGEGE